MSIYSEILMRHAKHPVANNPLLSERNFVLDGEVNGMQDSDQNVVQDSKRNTEENDRRVHKKTLIKT